MYSCMLTALAWIYIIYSCIYSQVYHVIVKWIYVLDYTSEKLISQWQWYGFFISYLWFFFLNTQSNISQYVSIKKTHTMTTRAALTEFIYILTFTKEDLFSSVSLCLLVCLTTGLHKNYWMDLHKTWMKDGREWTTLTFRSSAVFLPSFQESFSQ